MKALIDVRDVTALVHVLESMEHRITDFSIPLTDAARAMEHDIREAFPTGGGSLGLTWAPHTEKTIERWGVHAFGEGPGSDAGEHLLDAFRIFVRPFVAGVENRAPHAHLFEHGRHGRVSIESAGGTIKRRHTPELPGELVQVGREFMVITEATTQKNIDFVLDYAVRDIAA